MWAEIDKKVQFREDDDKKHITSKAANTFLTHCFLNNHLYITQIFICTIFSNFRALCAAVLGMIARALTFFADDLKNRLLG